MGIKIQKLTGNLDCRLWPIFVLSWDEEWWHPNPKSNSIGLVIVSFWSLSYIHKEGRKEVCNSTCKWSTVQDDQSYTCVLWESWFWSCASVDANKWRLFFVWVWFRKNLFSVCRISRSLVFILFLFTTTLCTTFWKLYYVWFFFIFLCFQKIIINFSCDFEKPCSRFYEFQINRSLIYAYLNFGFINHNYY